MGGGVGEIKECVVGDGYKRCEYCDGEEGIFWDVFDGDCGFGGFVEG